MTDEGKVIYTTVQEGYKEGIQWLHELVEQKLVDPEAFTQGMVYLCGEREKPPLWSVFYMGYFEY